MTVKLVIFAAVTGNRLPMSVFDHIQLPFIVNLLLLLLAARVFGEVAERLRQPAMIGEVLAGVLLGPSVLNLIHEPGEVRVLAELGVFMLILLAGMEIEVEEVRKSIRGRNLLIALLGFTVPMASGIAIGLAFNFSYTFTIFLGLSIAITALPVSIRILMDLGRLRTDIGQRIISAAIFNDIVALLVLGIILDFNDESKTFRDLTIAILQTALKIALFTAILFVSYRLFKLAKRKVNVINPRMNHFLHYLRGRESIFALVILFVLMFSSISELLGLHFVVGAFFGAILIPRSMLSNRELNNVQISISGITMGFLAPVFFATMGISFNLSAIDNGLLLLVILLASFASKILGGFLGGMSAGLGYTRSFTIGLGLNARGIMELVIANIALANGFIDISVFSILVIMALTTTIFTPFLLKEGFRLVDRSDRKRGRFLQNC